jgi:hypothetical protein
VAVNKVLIWLDAITQLRPIRSDNFLAIQW